jgi:C4-dicarboxylate-binding protein DctP
VAEKRLPGRVRVEVYPNSQLYKDKEEIDALQLGAVQMLAPASAKFGPLGVREFEVFDLPFIFPSAAVKTAVAEGEVGRRLFEKLEAKGIKGLAYWDNGFKVMSANKPLRSLADFRGVKFRIQSSKVLDSQFKALGALPQVMAFSEVYQALQTGVVDGSENTPSNMYTQKHHEVQKFIALSDHGYIGYCVIVNKKFWDEIPADIRKELDAAMAEATKFANDSAQKDNDDAIAAMKAAGTSTIYTLTKDERDAWRKAMLPVHAEMASRVGQEFIDLINKESKAAGF